MPWIKCDKLVRDGVLDFIKTAGGQSEHHVATPTELCGASADKLIEEARETAEAMKLLLISGEAGAREHLIEELGDLQQAILNCQQLSDISNGEVEASRLAKLARLRGFSQGIILERYNLGSNHQP